jgi:hypothetical protein
MSTDLGVLGRISGGQFADKNSASGNHLKSGMVVLLTVATLANRLLLPSSPWL